MNFYPFHIGDYASHTRHLSIIEDIAYRRLIDAYYLAEKPLTGEPDLIARSIGMREYEEEVEYVLTIFFDCTPDGYINKRADEEIAKYRAKADSARNANRIKSEKISALKSEPNHNVTKNQEPLTNNHSVEVAKAPKAQRLKIEQLPEEWQMFCKTERPDLNPQAIWNQFKDYWIAQGGQKGAKLDWFATWRNWVRNQKSVVNYTTDKPVQKWDATFAGVMAKGKELGILPIQGETEGQYRERVKSGYA
jgi:uncharacterized protein YdaU (DUF1376 family)